MKGAWKWAFNQLCGTFVPKNTAGLAMLRLQYFCVHSVKHTASTTGALSDMWQMID